MAAADGIEAGKEEDSPDDAAEWTKSEWRSRARENNAEAVARTDTVTLRPNTARGRPGPRPRRPEGIGENTVKINYNKLKKMKQASDGQ
jgi:hypothetical protein